MTFVWFLSTRSQKDLAWAKNITNILFEWLNLTGCRQTEDKSARQHRLSCVSISFLRLTDKWDVESWEEMSYGSLRLLARWCTALTPFKAVEDTVVPSKGHVGAAEQDVCWQNTWRKKSRKCHADDSSSDWSRVHTVWEAEILLAQHAVKDKEHK